MGLPFLPRTIIIFLGLGGKTACRICSVTSQVFKFTHFCLQQSQMPTKQDAWQTTQPQVDDVMMFSRRLQKVQQDAWQLQTIVKQNKCLLLTTQTKQLEYNLGRDRCGWLTLPTPSKTIVNFPIPGTHRHPLPAVQSLGGGVV